MWWKWEKLLKPLVGCLAPLVTMWRQTPYKGTQAEDHHFKQSIRMRQGESSEEQRRWSLEIGRALQGKAYTTLSPRPPAESLSCARCICTSLETEEVPVSYKTPLILQQQPNSLSIMQSCGFSSWLMFPQLRVTIHNGVKTNYLILQFSVESYWWDSVARGSERTGISED